MRRLSGIGSTIFGTASVLCLTFGIVASMVNSSYAIPIGPCARDVNKDNCEGTCVTGTCQDGTIILTCVCK
jgi:hypothetical protein